jgi:hypothetical protein
VARLLSAGSPLKRPAGVALLVGVTLTHLWLSDELMEDRLGFGAGSRPMQRIEVAYVRELAVAPPPEAPAPAPRSAPRPRKATVAKVPASAPQPAAEPSAPVVTQAEPPASRASRRSQRPTSHPQRRQHPR